MEQHSTQPPPGAGSGGEGAGQHGVDIPTEGRKRGPHPDGGKYVVLAAQPPTDVQIELTPDGEPEDYGQLMALQPRMVWWGPADDGKDAKEKALETNSELCQDVDPGGHGAWLVAVPLMNIKWRFAKAHQPPPVYTGL